MMICIIALFCASYIILTRSNSRYPTNLCVVGCILCGIATDVIWSLFNFGQDPVLAVYGRPGQYMQLFYELVVAGVIYFTGLMITNIIKIKRFRKTKIILYICFALVVTALAFNLMVIKSLSVKIVIPGLSLVSTNITLICVLCVLVIAAGAVAISGRDKKPKANIITALILALLTVTSGAIGIYKCVEDGRSGYEAEAQRDPNERTENYVIF